MSDMPKEVTGIDEAASNREQELRLVVETIPTPVWRAGPAGDIEYINKRALEYFGTSPDEILGWGWMEKVHPDDIDYKVKTWLENLRSEAPHEAICRFRGADGQYRWFNVRGEPLRTHDGRIQRWYGVLIDINDRRKAEEALRESELKLRQIFEAVPGFIWSTESDDAGIQKVKVRPRFVAQVQSVLNVLPAYAWCAAPSGALTFVNKRTADYLCISADHPLRFGIETGAKWDDWVPLLHPDDREGAREYWSNCLRKGEGGEHSYRVKGPHGDYRWFLARFEPLRASDGTLLLWIGATLDIEELKRAEQALRESEGKFRDYADTASDWLWETDPDYKFTLLTKNAFGLDSTDRIGTACWDHALDLESEPEKWRLIRATLDSRTPFRDFIYRGLDGNGSPMYVRASGKPVFDAEGRFRGYRGSGADVTALMLAQEEHERLRQLESDLAHMNRLSMMGELAATLAHEIAQPIGTARNNSRAAMHFLDRSPPDLGQVREALACVVDDADRAGKILDRIRDHIKKATPRKERVDLNQAITDVIALAQGTIVKHGISVKTHLTEGLSLVQADRVQLQQVVLNLILNAVEAMGSIEEGVRELSITTEQHQADGVLVAVRDSGPGIEAKHLDRVFDAFYTTKFSGVGMGLSICRSIINAHGGRLWADVNASRGAVFQFILPDAEKDLTSSFHPAPLTREPRKDTVSDVSLQPAYEDNKRFPPSRRVPVQHRRDKP
jgi:PAS domain S-box-containing protein